MSNDTPSSNITVSEGLKLALAAGFHMTRPTVLKIFKDSGSGIRLGGRFFMPQHKFEAILQKGESNAEN